jgi:catechol 2,3-dioxygenase-like lactoylglutathione lyase family enzyme
VLRVSNTETAVSWYQRLGFTVEFEHSSGPAFDHTTAVLTRGELALILSDRDERDGSDGIVYLRVADVAPIAAEFDVPLQKSAIGPHIELKDPDGNVIRVVTDPRVSFPSRRGRFISSA